MSKQIHKALDMAFQALEIALEHFEEIEIDGEMMSPYDVLDVVGDARNNAEQPPRYVHRNGETEPPTVVGIYYFTGLYRTEWVELDETGGFCLFGIAGHFGVDSDEWLEGSWYGPVPEPEVEPCEA